MMNLPPSGSGFWDGLFSGKVRPELDFLATKMLLDRLVRSYGKTPDAECLESCRREFAEFLAKNENLPKVQNDIASIVRCGGAA